MNRFNDSYQPISEVSFLRVRNQHILVSVFYKVINFSEYYFARIDNEIIIH